MDDFYNNEAETSSITDTYSNNEDVVKDIHNLVQCSSEHSEQVKNSSVLTKSKLNSYLLPIWNFCKDFSHFFSFLVRMKIFTILPDNNKHSKIFFATFFSLLGCCSSLRINYVHVPHYQKSGENVKLECNYDLNGDVLYSVKWYRGMHEFFRFVPDEYPPMQVFNLEGLIVDTSLSDKNWVMLRSVSRKSSGSYRCEVSADAPTFHTSTKEAEMLVVDVPETVPNITGSRAKYHIGDELNVNCSSKSRPASSLMWYINEKSVGNEKLVQFAPEQTEDELELSRLGLKFIVGPQDFPNGILKIKCTATTAAVYYQSVEKSVEGQLPQTSPALESKGVYTGGCNNLLPRTLCLAMLITQFFLCVVTFSVL